MEKSTLSRCVCKSELIGSVITYSMLTLHVTHRCRNPGWRGCLKNETRFRLQRRVSIRTTSSVVAYMCIQQLSDLLFRPPCLDAF